MSETIDFSSLPDDVEMAIAAADSLPAAERAAAVAEICAAHPKHEDAIRALLHLQALERDYAELDSGLPSTGPEETGPEEIGPYRIQRVLGEGGMGTVYLAEQSEPVRRSVALKVVKRGMDSQHVLMRFEQERQALAVMSHAAIAKVFEAGATTTGQPFFAMEYVDGEPIHRYCDRHDLALSARLKLFQTVCEGVQHAHQKGVIHRDLKPSNILVAGDGQRHEPKIIDFGLARAAAPEARDPTGEEKTMLTLEGQLLGTPEYMSPEQASGDTRAVDTRTDVYALGVVLYRLLTGSLPFRSSEIRGSGPTEVIRRICHEEPQKPSTRIASTDTEGDRSDEERESTRRWSRSIRRDLDWIVMKALAKEPNRRYESASAFAADLARYLDHQPVHAGPPSAVYRARKLLRRYRLQFAAAGLVLLTVVVGAAVAIVYAMAAKEQERLATASAQRANDHLSRWARLADRRRLESLVVEAREDLWPAVPAKIPELEAWLDRARELAATLEVHRAALAELRAEARDDPARAAAIDRRRNSLQHARILEITRELEHLPADPKNPANPGHASLRAHRGRLRAELAGLRAQVARRQTWEFDDEERAFRHAQLAQLVEDLERLARPSDEDSVVTIPGVEQRVAVARALRAQATEAFFRKAWERLRVDVARSDSVYEGLEIDPIPGLVPIGVDEHSGLWELHHTSSGQTPRWLGQPLGTGHIEPKRSAAEGIVMILVPGRRFRMGARAASARHALEEPNVDRLSIRWEGPVHDVVLATFLLSKYEVTRAQWKRLVGRDPSYYLSGTRHARGVLIDDVHPVTNVSWEESRRACRRWDLELPTEAQWEYACRAGTGSAYFTGDDPASLNGYANLADASSARFFARGFVFTQELVDSYPIHAPVGSFKPNPFGFCDIIGNVQEWCAEELHAYDMWQPRPGDGRRGVWFGAPRKNALVRGGSHAEHANYARCASRVGSDPEVRTAMLGLRPARNLR